MARVLLVGYDPETVDYSNPALPPGMSAQKIRAGIALTLKQMTDRGWEGDLCFIRPDETAGQTVERHLASANYTCVVIGAGVRLPPQGLEVFEAVVNAVHRGAPGAAIAFNTRPEDSADAAARWMPHDPGSQQIERTPRGQRGEIAGATAVELDAGVIKLRTPDQYRELAAECYRLASEAKTEEHQKIMREMAQALREVAEELETKIAQQG